MAANGDSSFRPNELRLLVLTPYGKDAAHLCRALGVGGYHCVACADLPQLAAEIAGGVGAIITTNEVLASPQSSHLLDVLQVQQTWSAIPILAFCAVETPGQESLLARSTWAQKFTDVNFLPRPVSLNGLRHAVEAAVRDRVRQYRTRELIQTVQREVDASAAREIELQRARVAADGANQSKSQFLANMSHEIRTPLGAIMGYADLISKQDVERDELQKYVAVIRRNSAQLLRIIDDILDLSKVEAGKMAIEAVELSPADLLADVFSLLTLKAREKSTVFEMTTTTELPSTLISDPTRLRQILVNVVGNAIKFTERGRVELVVSFAHDILTFEVRDTGRGISPEQQALLFEPFTQADASTTRKFGGTGLGLALTRKLCVIMGGEFFLARSAIGEGSTFVARVRAQAVAQAAPEPRDGAAKLSDLVSSLPPPSQNYEGLRFLVVEDSRDNQELIRLLLQRSGAEVDLAENGAEGLELFRRKPYHAILMDVQMPVMDGITAVKTLRQMGCEVPVIAITAHAMNEERERCLAAGFTTFLPKPVEQDALLGAIAEYLAV